MTVSPANFHYITIVHFFQLFLSNKVKFNYYWFLMSNVFFVEIQNSISVVS